MKGKPMLITIFISMKFRVDLETVVTDYVRDIIEIDAKDLLNSEQLITERIDALTITLNKIMTTKLKAEAVA